MSGLIGVRGEPLYPPQSVADQAMELSAANARIAELEAALRDAAGYLTDDATARDWKIRRAKEVISATLEPPRCRHCGGDHTGYVCADLSDK